MWTGPGISPRLWSKRNRSKAWGVKIRNTGAKPHHLSALRIWNSHSATSRSIILETAVEIRFKWVILFKSQMVTVIDDFTSLVWCGAVHKVKTRGIRICVFLNADFPAAAKASLSFQAFAARLKSCPDTKRRLLAIPKPRVWGSRGTSTAVSRITGYGCCGCTGFAFLNRAFNANRAWD